MEYVLSVKNLSKNYGKLKALNNVSLNINKGEILGLLGPNGAGKSTLIKVLTGYHFGDSGEVTVLNYDMLRESAKAIEKIGYVPEKLPLYEEMTVKEFLNFIADSHCLSRAERQNRIQELLDLFSLEEVFRRPIKKISKGFRQRVAWAQCLMHDPDILILDEPTNGLDPHQVHDLRQLIRKLSETKTIIFSSHILQEIENICSRVIVINKGEIIAQGTTEEIQKQIPNEQKFIVEIDSVSNETLQKAVKNLEGLKHFEVHKKGSESLLLHLIFNQKTKGNIIYQWSMKENLNISSLQENRSSLEDLFITLTQKEKKENV